MSADGHGFNLKVPHTHLQAAMSEHRMPNLMVVAEMSTDVENPAAGIATFVLFPPDVMERLDVAERESVSLQLVHNIIGSILDANPPTADNLLYRSTLDAAQILVERAGRGDFPTDQAVDDGHD